MSAPQRAPKSPIRATPGGLIPWALLGWVVACDPAAGGGAQDARPADATRADAQRPPDAAGDGPLALPGDALPADAQLADALPADARPADAALDGATDPPDGGGAPARPNFIFILGEARGWTSTSVVQDEEVPDSRSAVFDTPHLERIAAEGMTFSDFYAPSPRCMPTRAAYFTGRSPAQLHMTFVPENATDGEVMGDVVPPETVTTLPVEVPTVGGLLKTAGYATAHFGKWHVGRIDPSAYGFDESDGPTSNRGPDNRVHPNPDEAYGTTDRGLDFMARQVAAGRPFYLQLSQYGGDDAEHARPETLAREQARLAGRDPRDITEAAVVHDMDINIGRLLAQLDALGIADRTYIFFSADHGRAGLHANEPLLQGKGSVWEGGIRVPLIIRGPGIPAGSHAHVRASQVDLLPTLLRKAGVALPPNLEGGDLSAVLASGTGEVARAHADFVVHFPHYDKDPLGPASALLAGDHKLMRFYEDGSHRLYDLAQDLGEARDLAAEQPDRVAELAARLDAYLAAVGAQLPGRR